MKLLNYLSPVLFLCASSLAQASSAEAERLKGVINSAIDVVYGDCFKEHTLDEKQAKVRSILEAEYELDVIIRRAIGRNWGLMNPDEQMQVLELVKQLVVKAYVKGMEGKGRPVVEMGESIQVTDKRLEIPSTITVDDTTYNVLYRLGKMRSGWQIYDIVAEDISVVSNYRQQIDDHFRKGNGRELIEKLRELLTKEDIDEDIQL